MNPNISELSYKDRIILLIEKLEEQARLGIDPGIEVGGRVPTNATSEFLTNKQQGDWAEKLILSAINSQSDRYFAVRYGREDDLSAGDEGFSEFYANYQRELNEIGKKPDLLIFSRQDFPDLCVDLADLSNIERAVAAFEIRSSAFLEKRYREAMRVRTEQEIEKCLQVQRELTSDPLAAVLRQRSPEIFKFLEKATPATFRELTFRKPSWNSTDDLRKITQLLSGLRKSIKILQTRDFLSITPKVEDIALVGRWIQRFGVRHFYIQVFFDGAFALPFEKIITIPTDSNLEEVQFRIERDAKNQNKTTVKISVDAATSVVSEIQIPAHSSVMKELARGRLLFFVTFDGESGCLDTTLFNGLFN